jgi:transcription elongation factor GreB
VSKAFTSEETADQAPIVRPRAPLPDGVPNYVTARGLALLHAELEALRARPGDPETLAQRRAELERRIATAERVAPPADGARFVRFGAHVRVEDGSGARDYRIVGVDEADPAQGRIAFVSPLARALLGCAAGAVVRLRTPGGEQELEIVAVDYEPDPET